MKWQRKYKINIQEVAELNKEGYSLVELSEKYYIPTTTLNRYLHEAGYSVYFNRFRLRLNCRMTRSKKEYICVTAWKRAMLRKYPYKCQVCSYDKIVEAHHILARVFGGKNTIRNGVLLCPNHHAEAHAKIIDLVALLKRGELLGRPAEANQQPSHTSSDARGMEGSETTPSLKREEARALRVNGMPLYLKSDHHDIVRTAEMRQIGKRQKAR